MDRIRVLHAITRLIVGGAQENTLLTVEGLHARPQYEVALLIGSDGGPEGSLVARARCGGIPVIEVPELVRPLHPVRDPVALVKIAQVIRNGGYHIVHTHSTKAGLLGRLAACWAKTPIVVHTLHSLAFHPYQSPMVNGALRVMKRCLARYTDHFISVSDAVRRGALAAGIGHPEQHSTVYSGMEVGQFLDTRVDRDAVRRALEIPPRAPVVGKVARLFHLKGHAELLLALPAVVNAVPDVRILLVGDGILQQAIREEARRLGVLERVIFVGLVPPERIPDYLAVMDVVVHTSLREGLARVLPQALAMGKPVVAHALDGSPEVVLPGVTGYLVRPGDTEGLANALVTLLRDPDERDRLGANGRRLVEKLFPCERMVDQIHHLYLKLLAAKGLNAPGVA